MIRQEQLASIIDSQSENFQMKEIGLQRESLQEVPVVHSYATIITGLRRCGKSTLLYQLMKQHYPICLYLNFEDIRLVDFDSSDFIRLKAEIDERKIRTLFFDEIQVIGKWEIFVHQLLREGFMVFITGSNATLLSSELGTHLTGRYLPIELFSFSYAEFLSFFQLQNNEQSLLSYLQKGGIPEYLKSNNSILLNTLTNDILVRDIAIRNNIKDVQSLRALTVYLFSNIGNLVSAQKLEGLFGIKSASTILEYFSYLKEAYLIEQIPLFSFSQKVQIRNPKKIYATDLGLINEVSASFTEDSGHKLENLIYLHLRRKYSGIYYYKNTGECDFIVLEKNKPALAIQVCQHIDEFNFSREYKNLLDAMTDLKLTQGYMITQNQTDSFTENGKTIKMIPAYQFITNPGIVSVSPA